MLIARPSPATEYTTVWVALGSTCSDGAVVSGAVVDSYSFSNRGAYRIDDETGALWVVSDRGVPRKGARVTVKGTIREGFNLGSLSDRIKLPPGIGSGLVMMESSHKAQD